jgi:hypothetical protein
MRGGGYMHAISGGGDLLQSSVWHVFSINRMCSL